MCGLCGELVFNGQGSSPVVLDAMTEAMRPRGPDAFGTLRRDGIGLGHRRLKIIDTSEKAAQPMADPFLGRSLVYNGAIYNYPELRSELQGLGYQFFSSGDTEVILKAYDAWGEGCVERFNGMFAFAIAERDSGRLFLARDRLGIKPLYYAETAGGFRFASSLPSLLAGGGIDTAIDPIALHFYLSFHAVVPAPYTILRGVRKLPPGHTLTVEPDGTRTLKPYWNVSFDRDPERARYGFEDWKHHLAHLLRAAIHRRMIADVPVGCLLSGGLDSSLVVGMLAEEGQKNLKTFSIGFESVGKEEGNEFQYSDIVAERFATEHHRIEIDSSRALGNLDHAIHAMSEPMVSHDCIGFFLLSEEVAKHVKVVQSGQGADEVFAGYHWYPPMLNSSEPVSDYVRGFFDRDHREMQQVLQERWLAGDHSLRFVTDHFASAGAQLPIDKTLRLDTTVMLVDDPVKRVDNMTMAWGLEARVPFLDHELVEFAATIPPELKVRDGGKYLLKEVARDVIPHEVIDRPKGYFPVPALKFLRGSYLEMVKETLHDERARHRGLFQPAYVETLLRDPETHITPLRGSKLWQLALLERWLQTHAIPA